MNRIGFIAGWKITDQTCDGLIEYFEESPDQKAGEVGKGHDPESKISTDITVCPRTPDERIENYLDELGQVCDEYTDLFPWSSKSHALWGLNTNFKIQKYNPMMKKRYPCTTIRMEATNTDFNIIKDILILQKMVYS